MIAAGAGVAVFDEGSDVATFTPVGEILMFGPSCDACSSDFTSLFIGFTNWSRFRCQLRQLLSGFGSFTSGAKDENRIHPLTPGSSIKKCLWLWIRDHRTHIKGGDLLSPTLIISDDAGHTGCGQIT